MIEAANLRELLAYEQETGTFRWRVRRGRHLAGSIAGSQLNCRNGGPYRHIGVNGKWYLAHRLAWLWMTGAWPDGQVDHIDGDGLNNCWSNLRSASQSQNMANVGPRSNNTTGFKGAYFDRRHGMFFAQIQAEHHTHWLGYFETAEEANAAYAVAADKHFGQFARSA